MKIKSLTQFDRNIKTLSFVRQGKVNVELLIEALPLNYTDTIDEIIPSPVPPKLGYCRDEKRKFIKDAQGSPIPFYDREDPKYKKEVQRASSLQMMAMILKAIDLPENNIEWESKNERNTLAFYEDALEEFKSFGFSSGDLLYLIQEITSLSRINSDEIEDEMNDFLSKQGSENQNV